MSKHPLNDKFDIAEENLVDYDGGIEIPEDKEERDLDLIIDFALKAYRDLFEIIQFVEPSNRLKYYEMGERYLNQAKDARAKKEKLEIDREKVKKAPSRKTQNAAEEEQKGEKGDDEGISRKELQERLRAVR